MYTVQCTDQSSYFVILCSENIKIKNFPVLILHFDLEKWPRKKERELTHNWYLKKNNSLLFPWNSIEPILVVSLIFTVSFLNSFWKYQWKFMIHSKYRRFHISWIRKYQIYRMCHLYTDFNKGIQQIHSEHRY